MRGAVGAHALVSQHHTLWTPRRARGIDEIGEVIRSNVCIQVRLVRPRTGKQFLHIDSFACRLAVESVGCSDDETCLAVLEYKSDSVGWILRVTGNVCGTCFHDAKHGEDESAGSGQQQCYAVALLHATVAQSVGYAVGGLIHLFVGKLCIGSHQGQTIRLCVGIMGYTLIEEAEGSIGSGHMAQMGQFLLLIVADDGEVAHTGIGLLHHPSNNGNNALCQ